MLEETGSLAPDIIKRDWGLVRKSEKEKTNIIPFIKEDGVAIIASITDMVIGILCKPELPNHVSLVYYVRRRTSN